MNLSEISAFRWIVYSLFMLLAAALLAAVLTPHVRQAIQEHFFHSSREVLATAEGDVLNDSTRARVIKFRSRDGIWVEVLRLGADGKSTLIDTIALPDKHDGLFNFHSHVTRLAIADIDEDGTQELLAPTFDDQLVPHLNVFRFNKELNKFEPFPQSISH